MTPTRARTLVMVALGCGLAAWAALRVVYVSLPPLPWTMAPTLLLLAIVEAACGRSLRIRLRGDRGRDRNQGNGHRPPGWQSPRPVPPITVARLAALAKASSLVAAVFGGLAAGALVYLAASLAKPMPRQDALAVGGTLGAAILLVAAALYLEYGCRARPPRDEDEDRQPLGSGPL
jgi:4-amino-4-deoxy-L-arabinose transferase-like glycosyltransferase